MLWSKLSLGMILLALRLIWTLNFDCLCSVLDWSGFDNTICIYVHYGWWMLYHLLLYAIQQISVIKIKDFKQINNSELQKRVGFVERFEGVCFM